MTKSMIDRVVVLAMIATALVGVYYMNKAYQSALGREALENNGLTSFPLAVAENKARNLSRQVLVEVGAIWCPTCRTLDQYVLSDPEVHQLLNKKYLFSRLEYDSPEASAFLADQNASGYQSLWIVDGNGKVVRRLPFVLSPERFLAEMP